MIDIILKIVLVIICIPVVTISIIMMNAFFSGLSHYWKKDN